MFFTEEHKWIFGAFLFALRFYAIAAGFYFLFYIWKSKKIATHKIQPEYPERKQLKKEFLLSTSTMLIYGLSASLLLFWYDRGLTTIYTSVQPLGYCYLILSILYMICLHDCYFYWTHTLMHRVSFFYQFHKIHHQSHNLNPWSAFAFHPVEALLSLGIMPLIIFIIPVHPLALLIFFTIVTVYNIIIHLGYKIQSAGLSNGIQNTAENHELHHREERYNFGLYFTFWDKIMKTYR
ncbi:sterol desaturase family protein [Flavobacterium sp. GCM10023249]|uniref:sterol desaturase family protein n=1 Tax=unclassified Flavobacterium TaxID=196869 RepID=UPI00360D1977